MSKVEQLDPKPPRLLREREAAFIIGFSVAWLRRSRWEGKGPPYRKVGKAVRYPEDLLVRWIELHPLRPTAQQTGTLGDI